MVKLNTKGFTLIEILVVIGLIAILAAVTIIAINPAQNFADARDAERQAEITQILNAISQDVIDGATISGYTDGASNAFNTTNAACGTYSATDGWAIFDGTTSTADEIDLNAVVVPTYVAAIPVDPSSGTVGGDTGYRMCAESATRLTVFGQNDAATGAIQVSR